jgi:hypothetical protein
MMNFMTYPNFLKILILLSFSLATFSLAQDEPNSIEAEPTGETKTLSDSPYLVINEIGFGVGYPTYQLYHLHYAFQSDVFGVVFRGSYTGEGLYLSLAGRYYTPIPVPVPTFVSVGAGIAGTDPTLFATFGVHAPLGLTSNFRATLEGGLAYIGGTGIQPVATLGIGYVFYVDTAPITEEEKRKRELEKLRALSCTEALEPDPALLEDAFDKAVNNYLEQARAQYAGTFGGLEYRYDIKDQTVNGLEATIEASVSGSVTVKATGAKESARGTITANFGWNGCSWSLLDYSTDF